MFRDYQDDIDDIAILYGHTSRSAKGDNRIYALAARRFGKAGTGHFESLVRTDAYSARDRYRSNLSLEALRSAPPVGEVQRRLKDFLDGVPVALAFSEHSDLEALRRFCGVDRIVDLNFAAEFFLQQLPSFSLVRLWKELMAKQHENMSFSAAELVELAEALIRHICWKDLNDSHRKTAGVIRYYLQRSKTLFGRLCCRLATHYSDFFGDLLSLGTDGDTPDWRAFLKTALRSALQQSEPGIRLREERLLRPDAAVSNAFSRLSATRRPGSNTSPAAFHRPAQCRPAGAFVFSPVLAAMQLRPGHQASPGHRSIAAVRNGPGPGGDTRPAFLRPAAGRGISWRADATVCLKGSGPGWILRD